MLILSADDWGYSDRVTAAIAAAFDAGVVTQTSAMVWQAASGRAAELARERRMPVGLHLNLTTPLRATDVPARVRERQLSLTTRFDPLGWRTGAPFTGDPGVLRDAIRDQLDRFREEIGEPTHLDGHHHVHVHEAVLDVLPALLPADLPIRAAPSPPAHEPPAARPVPRLPSPDATWELEHLLADRGGPGLGRLRLAGTHVVEIVTHPVQDAEILHGDAWRAALDGLELGSYRDLAGRP